MMIYECYCKPFQAWWILQLSSPSKPRLGQMGWHTSNANQSVGSDGGLWILEMSTWANTAGQDQERTTWATGIGDANCYHTTILANWAFLSKCVFSCRHPRTLLEAAKCDSVARQTRKTSSPISPASFWWEASALCSQQSLASSEKQKRSWTWDKTAPKQRKVPFSSKFYAHLIWNTLRPKLHGGLAACKQRSVDCANQVMGCETRNKMEQANHNLRKQQSSWTQWVDVSWFLPKPIHSTKPINSLNSSSLPASRIGAFESVKPLTSALASHPAVPSHPQPLPGDERRILGRSCR